MNHPGLINTSVFCSLIYELFSLVVISIVANKYPFLVICSCFYFFRSKIASKLMLRELSDTEWNRLAYKALWCIQTPPNVLQTSTKYCLLAYAGQLTCCLIDISLCWWRITDSNR